MDSHDLVLVARARLLSSTGEGHRIREAAGLSLSEVAGAVGIAVTTLWRWERGERAPRDCVAAAAWARLLEQLDKANVA